MSAHSMNERKWRRTHRNRVIGGVFGGLGEYVEVSPNIIRFGYVILTLFFTIAGIMTYIALYFALPKEGHYYR